MVEKSAHSTNGSTAKPVFFSGEVVKTPPDGQKETKSSPNATMRSESEEGKSKLQYTRSSITPTRV